MKVDYANDNEYFTVEKPADLIGMVLVRIEEFKPGVKRLLIREDVDEPTPMRPCACYIVYCPDRLVPTRFKKVVVEYETG